MAERCGLCGRAMPDIEAAVDAGWCAEFWVTESEAGNGPLCPRCFETRTDRDPFNPLVLPGIVPAGSPERRGA